MMWQQLLLAVLIAAGHSLVHPHPQSSPAPSAWQVVAAGPRDMRMYYHSYDRSVGRFRVGLATSPDGFRWTKQGPIFEVRGVGGVGGVPGWVLR